MAKIESVLTNGTITEIHLRPDFHPPVAVQARQHYHQDDTATSLLAQVCLVMKALVCSFLAQARVEAASR